MTAILFASFFLIVTFLPHVLGLSDIPYFQKMNVSQEEYTKTFNVYVKRMREKDYSSSYEKNYFLTFTHSGDSDVFIHSTRQLDFRMRIGSRAKVERATLRFLVSGGECSHLQFYQLRGAKKIHLETIRPHQELLPQWTSIEVIPDHNRINILIDAPKCRIFSPAVHVLLKRGPKRTPRAAHQRTDCSTNIYYSSAKKQRCCRHKMEVVFKELPGYEFIVQPYRFDAGYCKGGCPYRYNPANHHASLQSLIWRQKKGGAPKPCCAPSKLEQLEIIHIDEDDPNKLKMTTWSDMKVLECACF
ncbi:unnamed protein product [Nezara viridula]|uniref:TGF-beta family profile domain-containing protein n=1 Tax=Nezara viridula TaxID=85310 RepID=A0A9P0EEA8_NEZVI|nr:unnamed protein product [Nezara viridula]